MELLSGQFTHAHFEAGRVHDLRTGNQLCESVQPKELILRNLGYLNLEELEELTQQNQRFFISRLRSNAVIYTKNPSPSYYKNGKIGKNRYICHANQDLVETVKPNETKEFKGIYVGKIR